MATRSEVKKHILDPMTTLYRVPSSVSDVAATLKQWAADLTRYDVAVLKAGWELARASHTRTTWPHLHEVRKALDQAKAAAAKAAADADPAAAAKRMAAFKKNSPGRHEEYWTEKAKASPLYARAVAEGVPLKFIAEAVKASAVPEVAQISFFVRAWEAVKRDAEAGVEGSVVNETSKVFFRAMIERNAALIQEFVEGAAADVSRATVS